MDVTAQKATILPGAEPTTEWADFMADILVKPVAANFGLGDKALGFIEAIPAAGVSGQLRKKAWPLFVSTAIHVKLMEGINRLPVSTAEAWVARKVGALALITQGTKAHEQVRSLAKLNQDRLRNAARALNNKGLAATQTMAKAAASNSRATALGGLFDVGNAIIKGYQLGVKKDARTAVEMVGNLLQGTGSVLDWRAKVYEETVFKGIKGKDLFISPAMREVFDEVQATTLKGLRLTAFKFLLPAALISIFWDATDGLNSLDRKQFGLGAFQLAGAFGTAFTIAGVGLGVFALGQGATATLLTGIAATLGLIGAALAIVSVAGVLLLKEDEWIVWLRDIPLSRKRKGEKPIHENLSETQNKLASAMPAPAM